MTKHIISEKLKNNLSNINSASESNVSNMDDPFYSKISAGQNTAVKMNDSFSDIAAKIFNLIALNKKDRKQNSKIIREEEPQVERYSKIESDTGEPKVKPKPDEMDTEAIIEGYEAWRIYEYWKMLKSGDNLAKLMNWVKGVNKNILDFKWLKDIANFGLNIVKTVFSTVQSNLGMIGTISRIGLGVGSAVGMSKLIAGGESGKDKFGNDNYNAANRGLVDGSKTEIRKYSGGENFSGMTVGEISRRQHLSRNDSEYISAVGKYQMIRMTMDDAIRRGFVKPSETFSSDVQERLFSEYLIKGKRPEIVKYLEAAPDDPGIINGSLLDSALRGLSQEFASVEYKSGSGVSTSGQKASISAEQASAELLAMRNETQGIKPATTETPAPTTLPSTIVLPTVTTGENLSKQSTEQKHNKKQSNTVIMTQKTYKYIPYVVPDSTQNSIKTTSNDMPLINQR